MSPGLRIVLAVLAGVIAGFALITFNEWMLQHLFPAPAGLDLSKPEQMAQLMSKMPISALVLVVTGWGVGSFVGGALAGRIAGVRARNAAIVTGLLFLVATLMNLIEIPHPAWMWAAGVVLPMPLALLGGNVARRKFEPVPT